MSPITRKTLVVLGWNLLAGLVLCLPFLLLQTSDGAVYWGLGLLVLAPLSLLMQLVAGIVLAQNARRRLAGQAMLLAVGIILLIGFSVCGSMWLTLA